MLTIIIVAAILLYAAELMFLLIGLWKADKSAKSTDNEPTVSVIVAARNEENSIGDCLSSILALDYPVEKLEIVAVNDGSTDRTVNVMQSFSNRHPNLKVISTDPADGNLRGKANALAKGIASASGEILMFTDADCRVPRTWLKETINQFDDSTGIVGGYTMLESKNNFEGIQALDWLFLFSLASSGVGWGIPLTVIGNNLSISRKAYDSTGGFYKIPFSVTEDYALVRAAVRSSNLGVKFPMSSKTLVHSKACSGWKEIYRQKLRWGTGGLDMIFFGFLIMAIGYIAKLLFLAGLFILSFKTLVILLSLMFFTELGYLLKPIARFGAYRLVKYYPFFFIYLFVYVLLLPLVVALSQNVVWKARTISSK